MPLANRSKNQVWGNFCSRTQKLQQRLHKTTYEARHKDDPEMIKNSLTKGKNATDGKKIQNKNIEGTKEEHDKIHNILPKGRRGWSKRFTISRTHNNNLHYYQRFAYQNPRICKTSRSINSQTKERSKPWSPKRKTRVRTDREYTLPMTPRQKRDTSDSMTFPPHVKSRSPLQEVVASVTVLSCWRKQL